MKKIYMAFMALAFSTAAMTQTISIGTDETTPAGSSFRSPWSPLYNVSYVQTIYLQSEINTAGLISSLQFSYAGPSLENGDVVTVWMGTVARSEFASTTDWEPVANLTQVFDGMVSYTSLPGIVTINLATPYNYLNTENLIIAIDENTSGAATAPSFYATDMSGAPRTIYYNDDDETKNPDPLSPPDADGIRNRVANIQIVFASPTPVSLGNLSAENFTNANKLNWVTHSEQNNKGFDLQRSADGTSFSSIAFVESKARGGNSNGNLAYSFKDVEPLAGTNYYRLKQVDLNNKSVLSNVVNLKNAFTTWSLGVVYPNPTNKELNIVLSSPVSDKATVYITDLAGKVVYKTIKGVAAGNTRININASGFAKGIYAVKAVYATSKKSVSGKFVKQ